MGTPFSKKAVETMDGAQRGRRYLARAVGALLVAGLVLADVAHGESSDDEDIRAAQAECDALAQGDRDLSLYRAGRGRWRRYSVEEYEEMAALWLERQRIRVADIYMETSDNSISVRHCFRSDGSLAQIQTRLHTFYAEPGPVTVQRTLRFDRAGRRLSSREQVLDSEGKPTKADFARWALVYERVFPQAQAMHAFFGAVLRRYLESADAGAGPG